MHPWLLADVRNRISAAQALGEEFIDAQVTAWELAH
jgi:hypothetical protein